MKKNPGPYLVVVPLSTMNNWALEFGRWAPAIKVLIYKGQPEERATLFARAGKPGQGFNVLLMQYEYVMNKRDAPRLRRVP